MPQTPNYRFERKERDRAKAAKKAEKLAAKAAKKDADRARGVESEAAEQSISFDWPRRSEA